MRDGFVKVASAIPALKIADCAANAENIINTAKKASELGCEMVVFPELSVSAYSCGDLFFHETLISAAEKALERILHGCAELDMLIFVGLPVRYLGKLYNCAAAICAGKLLGIIPKTSIPGYGEFSESRYFASPDDEVGEINIAGQSCAFGSRLVFVHDKLTDFAVSAEICEDAAAQIPMSSYHCMAGATVIANLSASPEYVGQSGKRLDTAKDNSRRNICGYVYASAGIGETTTDLVFSGHSFIVENGNLLAQREPFADKDLVVSEIDVKSLSFERRRKNNFSCKYTKGYRYISFETELSETVLSRVYPCRPFVPSNENERNENSSYILKAQATALARRLDHTHSKKAVLGISGGLDSTLAIIVAYEAVKLLSRPATDILAITMPCFGTGKRTRTNAEELCERLGVAFKCVDIASAVKVHLDDIGHDETTYDVTYENAQARERTQVLMDIANSVGGIVVGTGDLSEAALGWATYNGDHMSMYSVNCSIPKTLVRAVVTSYADSAEDKELSKVLYDVLDTPVSPELVPSKPGEISQKTESIIGDYDLHDFFLYHFISSGFSPEKLLRIATESFKGIFDEEHIKTVLNTFVRRFFMQQFKRSCSPDGVKVSEISLSPRGDLKMPSDAYANEWLDKIR